MLSSIGRSMAQVPQPIQPSMVAFIQSQNALSPSVSVFKVGMSVNHSLLHSMLLRFKSAKENEVLVEPIVRVSRDRTLQIENFP